MGFSCACIGRASQQKHVWRTNSCGSHMSIQSDFKTETSQDNNYNPPHLPLSRDICFHSKVRSILSQEWWRVDVPAAPCKLSLLTSFPLLGGSPWPSHIVLWELGCVEPMQDTALDVLLSVINGLSLWFRDFVSFCHSFWPNNKLSWFPKGREMTKIRETYSVLWNNSSF